MATYIPVASVVRNPQQPRKIFDADKLAGMVSTIKKHGVIEPIVVYRDGDLFVLLDGERRWQSSILAGKKRIRAEIRRKPVDGKQVHGAERARLEQALIANIQRADMGPVEEGDAYLSLIGYGIKQNEIARRLGINNVRVGNNIAIARADKEIRDLVSSNQLYQSADLVRALMQIPDREVRIQMAQSLAAKKGGLKASIKAARLATLACTAQGAEGHVSVPAMDYASKKSKIVGKPPKWDALQQVGKVPAWELVVVAAEKTCGGCTLRDIASEEQCSQCPAVDLLGLMMGGAK